MNVDPGQETAVEGKVSVAFYLVQILNAYKDVVLRGTCDEIGIKRTVKETHFCYRPLNSNKDAVKIISVFFVLIKMSSGRFQRMTNSLHMDGNKSYIGSHTCRRCGHSAGTNSDLKLLSYLWTE